MSPIPEPNEVPEIGEFVRLHLPQILEYCQQHPEELSNLQDRAYSLTSFRQSYPVVVAIEDGKRPPRYWSTNFSAPFSRYGFWVTSEWRSIHTAHFVAYLREKGITPIGISEDFVAWAEDTVAEHGSSGSAPGGPRHRSYALGVSQNALVRYLLSNLGFERFGEVDWAAVRDVDFDGACAYCGQEGRVTFDHAVAINRLHLGEHRLGNLVPACNKCNAAKSNKDYRDFLSTMFEDDPSRAASRIELIEAHASKRGYEPIGANDNVTALIEQARAEIKDVADRYLTLITDTINDPGHESVKRGNGAIHND